MLAAIYLSTNTKRVTNWTGKYLIDYRSIQKGAGKMGQRGRPREFDREEALERAMLLFWERGYPATSILDLCGVMKVGSPSLYAAFENKQSLFCEAVGLYLRTMVPRMWDGLETSPTAREGIGGLLERSATFLSASSWPHGCMLTVCAPPEDPASAGAKFLLFRVRLARQRLLRRLQRGALAGEFSQATDLPQLARFYQSIHQGMSIQARDGADKRVLSDLAKAAMKAWDAVVLSPKGTRTLVEHAL